MKQTYEKCIPLVTNKLVVSVEYTSFFLKYGIVSYDGLNSKKNLSYEKLSNLPVLSVTGMRLRDRLGNYLTRFFVLTHKCDVVKVLKSLDKYDYIKKKYDELDDYDDCDKKRIMTSLAINSIGMELTPGFMYNDASLIVCDPFNFFVRKSDKEMVCLGIEVNPYLNLCAKTLTFRHPHNVDALKKNLGCVFMAGGTIAGSEWLNMKVTRITMDEKKAEGFVGDLDCLYIKEASIFHNNLVPYLPSTKKEYKNGKLFVLWEIFTLVNEKFKGLINLRFKEYDVQEYSDKDTAPMMKMLFKTYFMGRTIKFEDSFKTEHTIKMVEEIQGFIDKNTETVPSLFPNDGQNELIIRFCKNEEKEDVGYSHGKERARDEGAAVQHISIGTKISEPMVRKVLMELIVKDGNARGKMLPNFSSFFHGWTFYRYYQRKDCVYGTKMAVDDKNNIIYKDFGFGDDKKVDFKNFCLLEFRLLNSDIVKGSKDYMALKRDGNVYMIIDTDEIPVFNAKLINEVYKKMGTDDEKIKNTQFKNVDNRDIYINGYIGLKAFKTDGLTGEMDGSVAYLAGLHNINSSQVYDKVPRVKNIFCLSITDKGKVKDDMSDILRMLKFGFGRWGCNMAFPLPFKFMAEHLDDLCEKEEEYKCHWNQLRSHLRKDND